MRSDWIERDRRWANYAKYGLCVYCATDLEMLLRAGIVSQVTLDHIEARAKCIAAHGSADHGDENLAPCCHACNSRKRHLSVEEFIALDPIKYAGSKQRIVAATSAKPDYDKGYALYVESRHARGLVA